MGVTTTQSSNIIYPKDLRCQYINENNSQKTIDLLYSEVDGIGHFEFIHNIENFLFRNKNQRRRDCVLCRACESIVTRKSHTDECKFKQLTNSYCSNCRNTHQKDDNNEKIYCNNCRRFFNSKVCYDKHLEKNDTFPITDY